MRFTLGFSFYPPAHLSVEPFFPLRHRPLVELTAAEILAAVRSALAEDIGSGDVTTDAIVPKTATLRVAMVVREPLVLAGLAFAKTAFREQDASLVITTNAVDGEQCEKGRVLLRVSGSARAILRAERVALNFVQRLSGVASLAALFVQQVKGTQAKILDTRKTTPGWRRFEKYAVKCGGGQNHRAGLYDQVLIKDNHLAVLRDAQPNAIAEAISVARLKQPKLTIEVEADTLAQVRQCVEASADIILFDNMSLDNLRAAVAIVAGRAQTEASGGVTLQSVRAIAETGVNFISVGAITHSARAVDIALDFEES